ncbi:haloacid dehalogenase type II [Methyloligella halotolerans]|uniref:haloacid dehalogenase type II n=1 Tax=Methyloligella halotolerans TaxID=1177755 RepID=UPI001ABA77F0|nr:haloacid dehalogenase type II [Methyloligella halotolerans]
MLTALALSAVALFGATAAQAEQGDRLKEEAMKPKVIFFDVNETLLNLEGVRSSVAEALGGREDLLPLWFSTMLHHSLVETATGRFHPFGEVGVAALMMVAETNGVELTEEDAKTAILEPLKSLPPHPDVRPGLEALKEQGYTLVSLTNSSNAGVKAQLENAGLADLFDRMLTVEDTKIYKPNLAVYEWALDRMGVEPEEAMMVAAHGWDIAGIKAAGMQGVFVARPGKALYPLAIPPDFVVADLGELAEAMKQRAQ